MATNRDLRTWNAYVIVMSFVSLLCIGSMCYVLFQSGTNSKMVEEAIAKKNESEERARKENQKAQLLEMILGARPSNEAEIKTLKGTLSGIAELDAIEKNYVADMALLGPNVTDKNYRKLVETLTQTVRERNLQAEAQAKREEDLKAKYEATIKQETEAREKERARAEQLASDLERAQVNYVQKEKERQEEITRIQADRQKLAQRTEKEKRDLLARVDGLTKERDNLTKVNDALGKKLEQMTGEDFQYPQGKVTEVADGGGIVYLNLGKADGLRPGVRFGIVDDSVSRIAEAKPKAHVEVVEVNQQTDHLSRARVLPNRRASNILRGDKIYSPVWQPGKKVSIGLVGKIDIDGDGRDDRDAVKSLINQYGGQISVDLKPDGRQEGALTIDTRWLVVGEAFKIVGGTLEGSNEAVAKKWVELEQQAKGMGVTRIDLDKLMGWLRGSGEEDVVPLGSASRASDFVRREPPPPSKGRVSGLYQSEDGKARPSLPD